MRILLVPMLLLGACAASPPVASLSRLPDDSTQTCHAVCEKIGTKLSAVVVVAGAVGCVCDVTPGANKGAAGAAASGAAAIIAANAAAATMQAQQAGYHR